jgi:pimeloyl-ACP methyl ester carboxylesterase
MHILRRSARPAGAVAVIASLAVTFAGTTTSAYARADNADVPKCAQTQIPTGDLEIAGTLCSPTNSPADTVMVLVPGATYTSAYWDVTTEPHVYNFKQAMNRGGYSTFILDSLGTGASSKPLSTTLTLSRQADAVHDVIRALRSGVAGSRPFTKVLVGGHSIGSTIVITEVSKYHDADAVLLTGFSHYPNPAGMTALATTLMPATLDKRFAGLDPGYLTTRPETRSVFYGPSGVTPEIAAYDETNKDVVSAAESPGAGAATLPVPKLQVGDPGETIPPTDVIRVPVLLVNGNEDPQFCTPAVGNCADTPTFEASERPFFSDASTFEAGLITGAGHALNLSPTAPTTYSLILEWAKRTLPANGR